jgi:membrane protein DedA with SNARE-associated domain
MIQGFWEDLGNTFKELITNPLGSISYAGKYWSKELGKWIPIPGISEDPFTGGKPLKQETVPLWQTILYVTLAAGVGIGGGYLVYRYIKKRRGAAKRTIRRVKKGKK